MPDAFDSGSGEEGDTEEGGGQDGHEDSPGANSGSSSSDVSSSDVPSSDVPSSDVASDATSGFGDEMLPGRRRRLEADKVRVFDGITQLLLEVASRRPLLIFHSQVPGL